MKKIVSLLMILLFVTSCLVIASAQPKKRKAITRGAAGTGARVRRNKADPGQPVTLRNGQRGRYVTRNGKRIWVPQGSPRRVYEREEEAEIKPTSNTNRP